MVALNISYLTIWESKILATSFSLLSFRHFVFKDSFSKLMHQSLPPHGIFYMLHNDFYYT